jgi:cytochrome c556
MKKLLILLTVAFAACTSQVKTKQQDNENGKEQEHTETAALLNNGSKWKADEVTKKNVARMVQVVNDSLYADAAKRKQLYATLQTKIDTLVKQCGMQGAEHNALHAWLKKVLKDMKKLKEEDDEYNEVVPDLKKDIEGFNALFE